MLNEHDILQRKRIIILINIPCIHFLRGDIQNKRLCNGGVA